MVVEEDPCLTEGRRVGEWSFGWSNLQIVAFWEAHEDFVGGDLVSDILETEKVTLILKLFLVVLEHRCIFSAIVQHHTFMIFLTESHLLF